MSLLDELRDLVNGVRGVIENIVKPPEMPPCRCNDWRPAITSNGSAKLCRGCGKLVKISDEDFYALFGELLYQARKTRGR